MARARNASVLSSDGERILAALNGWGVARIESSRGERPGSIAYRVLSSPLPLSFAGLTSGGAWPLAKGGFAVQLYRDPFGSSGAPAEAGGGASQAADGRSGAKLLAFDASGAASALDPFAGLGAAGFGLFALMPSGGAWLAELRRDEADRASMRYFELQALDAGSSAAREIAREEFEDALRPRTMAELPLDRAAALGAALEALGAGSVLVRARDAEGGDAWYLTGKRAEDGAPAYAWFARRPSTEGAAGGIELWLLLQDGSLARAAAPAPGNPARATRMRRLEPPVPGARFVALAVGGGLVAAAWEAGSLPELSAAGIVVAAAGE